MDLWLVRAHLHVYICTYALVYCLDTRIDTRTKATYKRKHSIVALLTVSEGESMGIMAGSMAAYREVWH